MDKTKKAKKKLSKVDDQLTGLLNWGLGMEQVFSI